MRSSASPSRSSTARANWTGDCGPAVIEVAVDDGARVDVAVAARVARHREVLGRGARVRALVEQAGAREAGGGAADRGDRHAGGEEALRRRGERGAAVRVPQLPARQDQQVAAGRVEVGEQRVGTIRSPPIVVIGAGDSATVTTSNAGAGEAPRAELGEQVAGLPVGQTVVDGDMRGAVGS